MMASRDVKGRAIAQLTDDARVVITTGVRDDSEKVGEDHHAHTGEKLSSVKPARHARSLVFSTRAPLALYRPYTSACVAQFVAAAEMN